MYQNDGKNKSSFEKKKFLYMKITSTPKYSVLILKIR